MADDAADRVHDTGAEVRDRRGVRRTRGHGRERQRRGPRDRSQDERAAEQDQSESNGTLTRVTSDQPSARHLAGVALVSTTLLMTELALTRIFSVVMYYHFAFLAISIALFGVSASGVFAFVARRRPRRRSTDGLLAGRLPI